MSLGSNISRGGGGRSSRSQNKAAFSWPGREWQEGSSGECSQLDRKNWFRMARPANREEAGCSARVSFPKPVAPRGWGIPPKGRGPNSTIGGGRGRDSDGLDALCYPKVVPILPLSSPICKVGIIQSPQAFCGPGIWKHSIHHNCH